MFQAGLGLHKKTQVLLCLSDSTSAPSRWHPHLQWIKNPNGFACGSASLLLTVFSYVRNHTLTYFFFFPFLVTMGIKVRVSHILDKCCTTK